LGVEQRALQVGVERDVGIGQGREPGRSRQPKGVDKDRIALAEAMELTDVPDPKRCWQVFQISVRSPMPIMTRTECLRSCAQGGWFSRYRHGSPM